MRLLVCGGRNFFDRAFAFAVLDEWHRRKPLTLIIHGAARGADTLAAQWASSRGVPIHAFPADWQRNGKAAGPIRNAQMLSEGQPEAVLAFPGGAGTNDMVSRAVAAGMPAARAVLEDGIPRVLREQVQAGSGA